MIKKKIFLVIVILSLHQVAGAQALCQKFFLGEYQTQKASSGYELATQLVKEILYTHPEKDLETAVIEVMAHLQYYRDSVKHYSVELPRIRKVLDPSVLELKRNETQSIKEQEQEYDGDLTKYLLYVNRLINVDHSAIKDALSTLDQPGFDSKNHTEMETGTALDLLAGDRRYEPDSSNMVQSEIALVRKALGALSKREASVLIYRHSEYDIEDIAKIYGVTGTMIRRIIKDAGIKLKKRITWLRYEDSLAKKPKASISGETSTKAKIVKRIRRFTNDVESKVESIERANWRRNSEAN